VRVKLFRERGCCELKSQTLLVARAKMRCAPVFQRRSEGCTTIHVPPASCPQGSLVRRWLLVLYVGELEIGLAHVLT
jgi:hypothetical protein